MEPHITHRRPPREWGPWRLDLRTLVLYTTRPYRYEVDLERCYSSAEVLDWICQIASKKWADDELLAGLIRALNDTLRPQATLCSFGHPTEIDLPKLKSLINRITLSTPEVTDLPDST